MICCLQSKGTRISSRKQDDFVGFVDDRRRKATNFTLKPSTKASSLQFGETEIQTNLGGKKKRNKRQIYGLLVNARDVYRGTETHGKKEDRKEEVTEVSMKLCLVFVCQDVILWFSLVFIDEGHQLELFF